MKTFETTIHIAAPAERVFALLTDAPAYPSWNTTVDGVDGRIALGEKITVRAKINPGRAFPVKVTALEPSTRMVWTGGMPLGLFTGVRTYSIAPTSPSSSRFRMTEVFSGPMLALIGRSLPDMSEPFAAFCKGLKTTVEAAR